MHDNFFNEHKRHFGQRTRRGDMAPIILYLLLDGPMHGYEIISQLEQKSLGMWRPSAGSIYPNLQLLQEQEMVKHEQIDGKKVYTLTDKGRAAAEAAKAHLSDRLGNIGASVNSFKDLRLTLFKIKHDLQEIAGLEDEVLAKKAKKILEDNETKLNNLLKDIKSS